MRSSMLAIALALALFASLTVSSYANPACSVMFNLRDSAVASNNALLIGVYSANIETLRCCAANVWKSPLCNPNSGPVCSRALETLPSECHPDVCRNGFEFRGPCKPALLVPDCYYLPETAVAERLECFSALLMRIVSSVNFNAMPHDPNEMLPEPCVVPGVYDRTRWRQADGSCNNPTAAMSYSGKAGLYFVRHDKTRLAPSNIDKAIASGPNPRVISNLLFKRTTFKPNRVGLSGLAFAWLNFFIHDFFGFELDHSNPIAVPIPPNDPVNPYNEWAGVEYYMYVPRTRVYDDNTFRNTVTSWFDGSQIYGNSETEARSLRTGVDGKLRLTADGMPADERLSSSTRRRPGDAPLYKMGDARANQHAGLAAVTILFMREHNRLCDSIKAEQPNLTDDEIYGTARNIVAAELVKIQTIEMSTQLVNDHSQKLIVSTIWSTLRTNPYNALATQATPHDFVASYRWHAMVPEVLQLKTKTGANIGTPINYLNTFHNTAVLRQHGIAPVLNGLSSQVAGWITTNNVPDAIRNVRHPDLVMQLHTPFSRFGPSAASDSKCVIVPFYDLSTVDILRDRERGVPRLNDFFRRIAVPELAPTTFAQGFPDAITARTASQIYNHDIENVDFVVGVLSTDTTHLDGLPILSTMGFLPFVYGRARFDRFFSEDHWTPAYYSQFGLDRVWGTNTNPRGITMAQILLENGVVDAIPKNNGIDYQTLTPGLEVFKVWNW